MTIADLKAAMPLPSLMERLGLGDRCKPSARCPFHSPDKRPSFGANKVNGTWLWNCAAGCGGGDEVTFLEKHFNLANGEAIARYKELSGWDGSERINNTKAKPAEVVRPTASPAQLSPLTLPELLKLSSWRGYSDSFCQELWLMSPPIIGTYKGQIAFPVTGGLHFRKKDGSWRYSAGSKSELFVLGELEEGAAIHCFESQWCALAYADKSGDRNNIVATRGASNAKLLAERLNGHTGTLYLWPQRDDPGEKWAQDVLRLLPEAQIKTAKIPAKYKDLNQAAKDGWSAGDIFNAFLDAAYYETEKQESDLCGKYQSDNGKQVLQQVQIGESGIGMGEKREGFHGKMSKVPDREARTMESKDGIRTAQPGSPSKEGKGGDKQRNITGRDNKANLLPEVQPPSEFEGHTRPSPELRESDASKLAVSDVPPRLTLATVLDDCVAFFIRYIRFPEPWEPEILSLWCALTWVFDAFEFTPYLHVCGPETNCGKSTVLKCVGKLARNPWKPIASPAALYLKVEKERPTLLLDELDAVFGDKAQGNEDLRAILNAGFERDGIVSRAPMGKVRDYNVFCPKALAGIGALPNTLSNRAIQIPMAKQLMDDMAVKLRERDVKAEAEPIAKFFAKWAIDNKRKLESARPEMPKDLDGRYEDIVEPLIAIADLAGDQWAQHARDAVVLAFAQPVEDSNNVKLLRSCRTAFLTLDADKLLSEHLVKFLVEMVEADTPWPSWWERDVSNGRWHGAARKVAAMLKGFGIHPRDMRVQSDNHEDRGKGYCKADFENAWRRYVPADIQRVQNQLEL